MDESPIDSKEDRLDTDNSPTVLHGEAAALLERAQDLLEEFEGRKRSRLENPSSL